LTKNPVINYVSKNVDFDFCKKINAKKDVKHQMLLTDYICNKKMKDNYNMLLLSCYFFVYKL